RPDRHWLGHGRRMRRRLPLRRRQIRHHAQGPLPGRRRHRPALSLRLLDRPFLVLLLLFVPSSGGSVSGLTRLDQADDIAGITFRPKTPICVARPDMAELVERFYEPLYRFAYSLSGAEHHAEDLTQETFYLWAEKGSQLRDASKVKS